MTSEWSQLIT